MTKQTLTKTQIENLENDVLGYILDGHSKAKIIELVRQHYPKVDDGLIADKYSHCCELIQQRTSLSAEEVINLHVDWYEKLFKKFDALDCVPGKVAALRQKEKILGLLKEENVIKIENEVNVSVNREPEYDMNKLTPEERKRLEEYLKIVTIN